MNALDPNLIGLNRVLDSARRAAERPRVFIVHEIISEGRRKSIRVLVERRYYDITETGLAQLQAGLSPDDLMLTEVDDDDDLPAPTAADARDQAAKCARRIAIMIDAKQFDLARFLQSEARRWARMAVELEQEELL